MKHNHYIARCPLCDMVVAAAVMDSPKDVTDAEESAKDWINRGFRVGVEEIDSKGPFPEWCTTVQDHQKMLDI